MVSLYAAAVLCSCGSSPVDTRRPDDATVPTLQAPRRARLIAARQREAEMDQRYRVSREDSTFVAYNPVQGLGVWFDARGPRVAAADESWQLEVEPVNIACGNIIYELSSAQASQSGRANGVDYLRSANSVPIIESYINGPLGLEQIVTIARSPCGEGAPTMAVKVELKGLLPSRQNGDGAVELRDAKGSLVARYSDLYAFDAKGRVLPARFVVSGSSVSMQVDLVGASWPVVIDPLLWGNSQLVANAASPVRGSISGDTVLLTTQSSYDIHVRSLSSWTGQASFEGLPPRSQFIDSALSGDTAVIASSDPISGNAWAQVMVRSGTTWTKQQLLTPSDAHDVTHIALSIDGDTAILGTVWHDGATAESGAVYAFRRMAGVWTEQQRLVPATPIAGDQFGVQVALSGDTALVGSLELDGSAQGHFVAHVYVRSGSTWSEQQKLTGAAGDVFGSDIAVSGDTALIAGQRTATDPKNTGVGFVFVRSGTTWSSEQTLVASGATAAASDVALSGNTASVVAGDAAYLFQRSGNAWLGQTELFGADRVDISGETALVYDVDSNAFFSDHLVYTVSAYAEQSTCDADDECASGHCVEHVCCDTACNTACVSCRAAEKEFGVDGVCGNIAAGTDPKAQCTEGEGLCGGSGVCDGAGLCDGGPPKGTTCAPGQCIIGTNYAQASIAWRTFSCTGLGSCLRDLHGERQDDLNCHGYGCDDALGCKADCDADTDCNAVDGYTCHGGKCILALGATCVVGGYYTHTCDSGHCVDGVCCESACDEGVCMACSQALTGAENGKCAPTAADLDPDDECEPHRDYPASCGSDGSCDGTGKCRAQAKAGTPCADTSCSGDTLTHFACTGTSTACEPHESSCGAYQCERASCGTQCQEEADCNGDLGYCVSNHTCLETKADSAPCLDDFECRSGSCVEHECGDGGAAGGDTGTGNTGAADAGVGGMSNSVGEPMSAGQPSNDAAAASPSDPSCSCRATGPRTRTTGPLLGALSFILVLSRRRSPARRTKLSRAGRAPRASRI